VIRRRAAYKFYRHQGLDDIARATLAAQLRSNEEMDSPDLAATDRDLVRELGLERILALSISTYYRMRAIALALDDLSDGELTALQVEYPQELLWALSRQDRRDHIDVAIRVLERYRHDPYLVNYALDCVGRLGTSMQIAEAVSIAETTLLAADS
jgi:hypothetical protein